ncbi:hypothetical protein PENSPDRAFT_646248 [Peniophora sp. CONT]|nr:hypothetical protein PENSPDRAFT_646248 [Peniophora sp. CONT]
MTVWIHALQSAAFNSNFQSVIYWVCVMLLSLWHSWSWLEQGSHLRGATFRVGIRLYCILPKAASSRLPDATTTTPNRCGKSWPQHQIHHHLWFMSPCVRSRFHSRWQSDFLPPGKSYASMILYVMNAYRGSLLGNCVLYRPLRVLRCTMATNTVHSPHSLHKSLAQHSTKDAGVKY